MDPAALRAIRAWLRLDRAFDALNAYLRRRFGVTGAQLAMLRILAEREPVTLAQLRAELALHPATIGQLFDRLVRAGLVSRRPDHTDHRRRLLELTPAGRKLLAEAPLVGPVRLRSVRVDPPRLDRLADAFTDAISHFGMEEWAT